MKNWNLKEDLRILPWWVYLMFILGCIGWFLMIKILINLIKNV